MSFAFLRRWSIQRKLTASLLLCLACFIMVSVIASVTLTGRALERRVVEDELPAVLASIRADVQRRIAEPLTAATSMADNHYLLQWEAAGLPDDGLAAFQGYAARLKRQHQAASVFWISQSSGKYLTDGGLLRQIGDKDAWFRNFLASGKRYSLNIDRDASSSVYMLFINARYEADGGRLGVAGVGLGVDALAAAIRDYRLGETGTVMLVRPNGTLLVHRDPALVDGRHALKDLPGFDEASASALLTGERPFTHALHASPEGERVIASSFVPELNLYVVSTVPKAELLGAVTRAAWTAPLVAGVIGGALALVLVMLVARAIAGPVRRAAALLGEIADGDGDLSRRMKVESDDEIGQLAAAFNRFVESLQRMVQQVRQAADSIADSTAEVATGNLDLSQRTERASSSLQQTASAMSEITDTVRHNADATREADSLARSAHAVATRSGTTMGEVERTMSAIDDSSKRIGDIIGVIDGIAFQTNILALNAAVEAARAGEQGRGFAVVAGEVRSLAQRSAQAAKEVRSLIVHSAEQVQGGSERVRAAGATMRELIDSVSRVAHLIEGISGSTQGQSQGIAEVNGAVSQLDVMTQQNAALVEESSAAATSLREQAAALAGAVGRFKLA